MALTVRVALCTFASGIALVVAGGCSSVPDVQFGDGGTSSTSTSGSSGPTPPPDWACPDKRPPSGEGTCCGDRLCLKCSDAADCTKCEQTGCGGTISTACCRKNPQVMQCRAWNDC